MVAKKKKAVKPADVKSFRNVEERVNRANEIHNLIGALAYGKEPEKLDMPSELSNTPLGGSFTTPLALPDPNDDSARVPLTRMLGFKQEGVNTADPAEIVRRAWEMPPATPTAKGTFMQRWTESLAKAPTPEQKAELFSTKTREIVTSPRFAENKAEMKLPATASPETIFGVMVDSRKSHLSNQLTDWYEGPRAGLNELGYPQYEKGAAVSAIETKAPQIGVPQATLRRGVALGSPKTVWQTQSGYMPNLEGSARTTEIALSNPELSNKEVTKQMKAEFSARPAGQKGTILATMAPQVVRNARGELSKPWEPTTPPSKKRIGSEKVANFDLGLTNPYHPEYGYSSYAALLKSRPHTADTHDMGAANVKTPSVQVVDEQGNPQFKTTPTGARVAVTTNAGEEWAEKVGGQDILGASARVASAEQFWEHYTQVGKVHGPEAQYKWGRENAHLYTPNNAQAGQWVESMRRGKIKSAVRRVESAKARRAK